jgi:hypothetical protein
VLTVVALVTIAVAAALAQGSKVRPSHRNTRALPLNGVVFKGRANEASRSGKGTGDAEGPGAFAAEQTGNAAYPATAIGIAQVRGALQAFLGDKQHGDHHTGAWQLVGPTTPRVPGLVSNAGSADTTQSGRLTAVAVSPGCSKGGDSGCKLLIGAAGGGVWVTDNALAAKPEWKLSSDGLPTNAVGSIAFDPNDSRGQTVYVGTGEPNGSSDSEAGLGLFRSTDGGQSWTVVQGSVAVSAGRSIGGLAIDPKNPNHIFIGTAVARHGSSSSNGGRFTPPAAPQLGLYESTNGGASFSLVFSKPADTVDPTSPNGGDFFRGGVSDIKFDPIVAGRIWLSIFDYGLYRSKTGGGYEEAFASPSGGDPGDSIGARTEFALAPMGSKLRIYVGDASLTYPSGSQVFRTDDAEAAAPAWTHLVAGDGYCGGQCSYDMPVASPAGSPNEVWIGGQMQYDEIGNISNGRSVQRSTDSGATFTDMSLDANNLALHPDNHAIAFGGPGVGFIASDGGIVRTNGKFQNTSSQCAGRGLSGSDLAFCQAALTSTPKEIVSMNDGLSTLQFQSLSVNPNNPNELLGGTQDNGTWSFTGKQSSWYEAIGGDGGQSGIDVGGKTRMHTYYGPSPDVNFRGTDTLGWDWTADPLGYEAASFYVPLIADPKVSGTWFLGQQHVWRTQDNGGDQAFLDKWCNEYTGDYGNRPSDCGDWIAIGGPTLTGGGYGTSKGGSYVVVNKRAPSDTSTLWAGTRRGRIFVSTNAQANPGPAVVFDRIDTAATPTRFPSGITIDPANPYHAWVSYSGYNAYATAAGTALGHVFEVTYNPGTHSAVWTDLSNDLGDQPVTDISYDGVSKNLYASTDWGVLQLKPGAATWANAAPGLPLGAVYGLTLSDKGRVLYAATHGRGAWALDLSGDVQQQGNH